MLSPNAYMVVKSRLLIASDMCRRLVNNGGESVEIPPEHYQTIASSMLSAPDDVATLLAEMDVLRALLDGQLFDVETGDEHGRSQDVEGSRGIDSVGSGEGERDDAAVPSGTVRPSGADGPEEGGPKPKRNRRRNKKGQKAVDKSTAQESVDSSAEA